MNARFGKYVTVFVVTFMAGALYGVFWEHCFDGDIKAMGPATAEDLAQVRAGMTKPVRLPIKVPAQTNGTPVS